MENEKKRLVTRSDFDGLVCAMILKELDLVDDILFVHPKDVQDGKIEITSRDITTNLPFDSRVGLSFDHHESELTRLKERGIDPGERLIIDPHPRITDELMAAVDKGDSADYTLDEILNPKGWVLMNFLMDARTGLGRFRNFTISNYDLMMKLIGYCVEHTIDEVLALPDVKERVDLYFQESQLFREQLERLAKLEDRVVVLDLRNEEVIHAGNRFMIYALFPEAQISVHVAWGFRKQNTAVMIGKSIINKTSDVDIGMLCLKYGGGGHRNAGTCQLDNDKADALLPDIIAALNG